MRLKKKITGIPVPRIPRMRRLIVAFVKASLLVDILSIDNDNGSSIIPAISITESERFRGVIWPSFFFVYGYGYMLYIL